MLQVYAKYISAQMIKTLFFKEEGKCYSWTWSLPKKELMTAVKATSSQAFVTTGLSSRGEDGVGVSTGPSPKGTRGCTMANHPYRNLVMSSSYMNWNFSIRHPSIGQKSRMTTTNMIPLPNPTDNNNVQNDLICSEACIMVCTSHFYRVTDGCELMKARHQKTLKLFQNECSKWQHMAEDKFCVMLFKSIRWILASTCCFFLIFSPLSPPLCLLPFPSPSSPHSSLFPSPSLIPGKSS